MALILVGLKLDVDCRVAALLFALPKHDDQWQAELTSRFGAAAMELVGGVFRLDRLRPITNGFVAHAADSGEQNPAEVKAQIEILRKMLLAILPSVFPSGKDRWVPGRLSREDYERTAAMMGEVALLPDGVVPYERFVPYASDPSWGRWTGREGTGNGP